MINTGIITKKSNHNFNSTYQNIINIINKNPNLKIILELDHKANGAKVGIDLLPTKLIIFGNPKLGTPLMQHNTLIGLDLPQKILITENEKGTVFMSYNDPKYLKDRYLITDNDTILDQIVKALDTITTAAIQ